MPHEAHAEWTPPKHRPSPVDIVVAGNAGRQEDFVPLRMARMAASPFAFLRGAAAVMAWDLSHTPVTGIQVIIDGDAHINNFGLYGTPQRDVIVDLNDFDEATLGPWEWDLKRLVASVNVAGRENGLSRKERRRAVRRSRQRLSAQHGPSVDHGRPRGVVALRVRRTPANGRDGAEQCVGGHSEDGGQGEADDERDPAAEGRPPRPTTAGGGSRTTRPSSRVWTMTRAARSSRHLSSTPSIFRPAYRAMLRRYAVADVAHRVVGVGSVGTRAYLALCFGNGDNDPLFLQVKEAIVPVHAAYLPPMILREQHEGRRVVEAQRLLQALGDPILGYTTIDGRDYFVRQMKNMKASMPVSLMTGEPFDFWAFLCGALLARAHARSGDVVPHRGLLRRGRHAGSRVGGLRRSVWRPDRAGPCRAREGDQGRTREGCW